MRDWLNLFDESYDDDTGRPGAALTRSDFFLTHYGFARERDQLEAEYVIDDQDLQHAVAAYTRRSTINAKLLAGEPLSKHFQNEYNALMSLKDLGCCLQEEHHVYSGTGLFDPAEVTKRNIFQTPAFLSTSLNVKVAAKTNNFRREEEDSDDDHLLHLVLPKGYRGCFYIGGYSAWPAELEMLIFPNEAFRWIESHTMNLNGVTRHIHTAKPVSS